MVKTGNRGHVLQNHRDTVGAIGNICRKAHKHKQGKADYSPASGQCIYKTNENTGNNENDDMKTCHYKYFAGKDNE